MVNFVAMHRLQGMLLSFEEYFDDLIYAFYLVDPLGS